MYQLLSKKVAAYVLIFTVLIAWCIVKSAAWFGLDPSLYRIGATSALIVLSLISVVVGWSGYRSPWRWLWRKFPILNSVIYPDLNGVWVGTTQSNWSIIQKINDAAKSPHKIDLESIQNTGLQKGGIAIHIEANLYSIKINARLSNRSSTSSSRCTYVEKHIATNCIRLLYIYAQNTPEPDASDESIHFGAAELCFELNECNKSNGRYWTRRSWRQGLNTAGILSLKRVSEYYDPRTHDLLQLANSTLEIEGQNETDESALS